MNEKRLLENSDPTVTNEQITVAVRNVQEAFRLKKIPITKCAGLHLFYTRAKDTDIVIDAYKEYLGDIPEMPYYLRFFQGMSISKVVQKALDTPFFGFCVNCGEKSIKGNMEFMKPARFWLEDSEFMLSAPPMRRSTNPRNLWYHFPPTIRRRLTDSNSSLCHACAATSQIIPSFMDYPKELAKFFSFVSWGFYKHNVSHKTKDNQPRRLTY